MALALELAGVRPGQRVLDVGAGRGEAALGAASLGAAVWGLDSSPDAVALQRELGVPAILASALELPLRPRSVDVVLMLDVVEHMAPAELASALAEAKRVLVPGGRLVVHTAPSLWYYRFGYPLYRALMRLRGRRLPADPRDRLPIAHAMHVNEQSPRTLRRALRQGGFPARVFLRSPEDYARETNRAVRLAMRVLSRAFPFRLAFCNDIFAVSVKAGGPA